MVVVRTGARLHFGFQNLSLARQRLYGAIGVAIDRPTVAIAAERAETLDAPPLVRDAARATLEQLDLPGARVRVRESLDRHVGLGSGTQHALTTFRAIARAYELDPSIRAHAPALGRGGRSGVGVATFESGGFVIDAGHPADAFTSAPPDAGEWTVPPVVARHDIPESWRFVVVVPAGPVGEHGDSEDASMRSVVERADPAISDDIARVVVDTLLPAVAEGAIGRFGDAIDAIGRYNGAWYAHEQGGVYRPPAGSLIAALSERTVFDGVGQSSWGPAVYAITDTNRIDGALATVDRVLSQIDFSATVYTARPRNDGADCSTTGPRKF